MSEKKIEKQPHPNPLLQEREQEQINNKKKLLEELASDIGNKFGIEKKETENLINETTLNSLDSLKTELLKNNNENKLDKKDLEKLFFSLKGALEVTENLSKLKIDALKNDIENNDDKRIETNSFVEKFVSKKLLSRAKNPKNIGDNIIGAGLGVINSGFATLDIVYQVGKGITLSPYHLYMIISGKAKTESFKNI